jgi:hypothetical protein
MILLTTTKGRARKTLLAAMLGGLAGGMLVPSLTLAVGAPVARAAFLAVAASFVLLVRGARGVPQRAALAGGLGALAALLEPVAPAGSAPLVEGLALALVLAPEGHMTGLVARLQRGALGAAFALLGAILVGSLAPALANVWPIAWDALLGAAVAVGAVSGELLHHVLVVTTRPPRELEEQGAKLSAEGRATVEVARGAYVRATEAVLAAKGLDAEDRLEALTTARDLAVTVARSSRAADDVARTQSQIGAGAAASQDVRASRDRMSEQLGRKVQKSRDDATRAATALAELAIAISERASVPDTRAEDLEARARGLAFRIGIPDERPRPAKAGPRDEREP